MGVPFTISAWVQKACSEWADDENDSYCTDCALHLVFPALAQDLTAGETSFKKWLPCHAVGEGAKNKVGPVLNGLDGRKSGTVAGFAYTEADENSGLVWDAASFKDYIKDPKAKILGTNMTFGGIKNEEEANNLWAYLVQFGPNGKKK